MKLLFQIIVTLASLSTSAQESYSELITLAADIESAEDSSRYNIAIQCFDLAFESYPDSITGLDLFPASILAARVNDKDRGFKYLKPLAEMETDEEGFPGWSYILDEYFIEYYQNLVDDKRWDSLTKRALVDREVFYKKLAISEKEFFATSKIGGIESATAENLYQEIRGFNQYLPKLKQNYSIAFAISDSTKSAYLVHLPLDYNPDKKYSCLVFLHGAVMNGYLDGYKAVESTLKGWNRFYTQYAALNEVVLVFPSGNSQYNWMDPDDGFFMVPRIIEKVKSGINLDDNKIFITGHSNGATGSFSYCMKQPSQFSGFYGFNTDPTVETGGTFIENILNRSFINFSTDRDYYYSPTANDSLSSLMNSIGADYKDYRYNGFPHSFPNYDESEPAYDILFSDMLERERNPFPLSITWQFDDNKYGEIDWLSDLKLDTFISEEAWQKNLNFEITKWISFNTLEEVDVERDAFNFPRKSGKVTAEYHDNVFRVETSCIESFKVNISPEMVDMKRKVKVYVNDKLLHDKKVEYKQDLMLSDFRRTNERVQVWVDYIAIKVK